MRKFNEAYEQILKDYNEILEKMRVKNYIYTLIFGAVLTIIFYLSFEGINFKPRFWLIIPILIICVCFYKILLRGKNTHIFKTGVIDDLVKEYDSGLRYYHDGAIARSTYNEAFFEQKYTIFLAEDLVKGTLKEGINLEFGDIKLYNEMKNEELGTKDKTKVFEGIFAKITLNTDFYLSKIKIRNNRLINLAIRKDNKIELESAEFEKYFDFYADDKIQALQVFTIDVIEKMNHFREKYDVNFEMTLYKNALYIRFPKKNSFEIKIGKNTLDYEMLHEYYKIIEMIGNMAIYFEDIIKNLM